MAFWFQTGVFSPRKSNLEWSGFVKPFMTLNSHDIGIHFTVFYLLLMVQYCSDSIFREMEKIAIYCLLDFRSFHGKKRVLDYIVLPCTL